MQKIGRNEPCGCHSRLRFEECCGQTAQFDADGNTTIEIIPLNGANGPETGTREGSMIVKVQTALNDPMRPAMVYDRSRAFKRFVPVEEVGNRMLGRPKAYFYARLSVGQLVLDDEAPQQDW